MEYSQIEHTLFKWTRNVRYLLHSVQYLLTYTNHISFFLSDHWPPPSQYSSSISKRPKYPAGLKFSWTICLSFIEQKQKEAIHLVSPWFLFCLCNLLWTCPVVRTQTHTRTHLCVTHSGVLPRHRPETSGFHNIRVSLWAGVMPH